MKVLVVIDPTFGAGPHHTGCQFTWHDDWKSALGYVGRFAQGDDPGTVTITSVIPSCDLHDLTDKQLIDELEKRRYIVADPHDALE